MNKDELKAVQMVRCIRDAHYEALKGKTREERNAFYSGKTEKLHLWLRTRGEGQTGKTASSSSIISR